ncbi:hypothetical protein LJC60_02355 [Ruminococcaceae bacterium OttesenSCG-928-D13]|nr:hypothetical protein [Ruminococcaceae bacterium OttesenSCG-928-D13]
MLQIVCVLACTVPLVVYLFYVAAGRQDEPTEAGGSSAGNDRAGRDKDIAA